MFIETKTSMRDELKRIKYNNVGVGVRVSMVFFSLWLHPHPDSFEILIKILSIKLLVQHIILFYNLIILSDYKDFLIDIYLHNNKQLKFICLALFTYLIVIFIALKMRQKFGFFCYLFVFLLSFGVLIRIFISCASFVDLPYAMLTEVDV